MSSVYDKGDLVRISVTFSVASVSTDPTTVTLKVKDPAGTVTAYTYALAEVARDAAGQYHKDITITETGTWRYRWEGTGAVVTAGEAYLMARPTEF